MLLLGACCAWVQAIAVGNTDYSVPKSIGAFGVAFACIGGTLTYLDALRDARKEAQSTEEFLSAGLTRDALSLAMTTLLLLALVTFYFVPLLWC